MRLLRQTAGMTSRFIPVALLLSACGSIWVTPPALACASASSAANSVAAPDATEAERMRLPRLVKKSTPHFPEQAAQAGVLHGVVYVQVVIDLRGRTANAEAVESNPEGLGFEAAAIATVGRYRYTPALQDGKPVAAYLIVPVVFDRERPEP